MKLSKTIIAPVTLICALITGCLTRAEINQGFRRLDRLWQLENQRAKDEFRYRVIEADYNSTFDAVRRTFIDLGIPVQKTSREKGIIIGTADAPTPLTNEEWARVAEIENPRAKTVGLYVPKDPTGYVLTLRADLKKFKGRTLVLLTYELDNPQISARGYEPNKHAPPTAVQLAATKFWRKLSNRLQKLNIPKPRRRRGEELFEI